MPWFPYPERQRVGKQNIFPIKHLHILHGPTWSPCPDCSKKETKIKILTTFFTPKPATFSIFGRLKNWTRSKNSKWERRSSRSISHSTKTSKTAIYIVSRREFTEFCKANQKPCIIDYFPRDDIRTNHVKQNRLKLARPVKTPWIHSWLWVPPKTYCLQRLHVEKPNDILQVSTSWAYIPDMSHRYTCTDIV